MKYLVPKNLSRFELLWALEVILHWLGASTLSWPSLLSSPCFLNLYDYTLNIGLEAGCPDYVVCAVAVIISALIAHASDVDLLPMPYVSLGPCGLV